MEQLKKYSPIFNHLNDAIAFAVHLSFLSNDCKLIGLNEDQYLLDLGSIPQGWNKTSDIYQFRYILNSDLNQGNNNNNNNNNEQKQNEKDEQKKLPTLLIKIIALDNNQLLISAVKQNQNNVFTLDISISDHINVKNKDLNDYNAIFKDIKSLLLLINEQITQKMIPSKQKDKKEDNEAKKKHNQYFDPMMIYPPNNNNNPLQIGKGGIGGGIPFGDNDYGSNDLNPFGSGIGGGNLFNPKNPNFGKHNRPPLVPGKARFDDYSPFGSGQPDPDHMKPPNHGNHNGGFGGFM